MATDDRDRAAPPQRTFAPSGFFVLRSPLLPIDVLVGWGEGMTAAGARAADAAALDAAVAADVSVLRPRLASLIARPELREALFVASPSLVDGLEAWEREPEGEQGQKVERALVRYVSRMAARATPFGLFAGTSTGRLADATALVLGPGASYRRRTRLDGDYLDLLCRGLMADPAIAQQITVRPNSSLYVAAGRVRYVEARLVERRRSHHLVAVEPSPYLDRVLERAAGGARPGELAAALVELDPEIGLDDAAAYVAELVAKEILTPDLAPIVTGPEPLAELIEQLERVPVAAAARERLARADAAMAVLDAAGMGNPPEAYRAIAASLAGGPAKVDLARLFQVDLFKPAPGATLGHAIVEEIRRGVELLQRLAARPAGGPLERFKAEFLRRYEGRAVSLVEVLDEETGIGFERATGPGAEAAPLLEGLAFPSSPAEPAVAIRPGARHLARRIVDAIRAGASEVVLEQTDLEALGGEPPAPVPDGFAVMAQLGAASPEALARGEFRLYLDSTAGPSGAALFGRFCHGDPALAAEVVAHLRAEEAHRPDAVYAEIVHLPAGRIGNVILRPRLREHEIPLLGRSGAPPDRQIPITDLTVAVEGERIVLRSRRLGREVIPRLTSAHNYVAGAVGAYRFLASLQFQGVRPGELALGPLDVLPFLPRLRHGRVVLRPARWRLDRHDLAALGAPTRAARFANVASARARLGLPRLVTLVDGDNLLPVDLENALSVDSLVQLVARREGAELREMAPGPDEAVVVGPEGRYQHELVVPFLARPSVRAAADEVARPRPAPRSPRRYPPASEWLYAKLYTGAATADQVLREVVSPVVAASRDGLEPAIDRWFFVRYGDPDWHVRLRLRGAPARLLGEVLPALHAAARPLLDDGRVSRLAVDTYDRELERYGDGVGIDLAERLFEVDSDAALAIVAELDGDAGQDASWRLALAGIDQLWRGLGLDLAERHAVAERAKVASRAEHPPDAAFDRALGERFRAERRACEVLLAADASSDHPLALGFGILATRGERLAPILAALREAERTGALDRPLREVAWDYAHMWCNRLLRAAARAQELVLYEFLARLYASQRARARS